MNHKHKGIVKSHPISQEHKDKTVQAYHNASLRTNNIKVNISVPKPIQDAKAFFNKKKIVDDKVEALKAKVKVEEKVITFPIDEEGYICLDLDITKTTGLRLMFTRTEYNNKNNCDMKRTVNLQFENDPARNLKSSEKFVRGRVTLDRSY